jgi:hypothetical protein
MVAGTAQRTSDDLGALGILRRFDDAAARELEAVVRPVRVGGDDQHAVPAPTSMRWIVRWIVRWTIRSMVLTGRSPAAGHERAAARGDWCVRL